MASMVSLVYEYTFICKLTISLGLIHWKIVIHAFIDGFSRYVLGIQASNNNTASTVLQLFEDIAEEHGYPSRVRGDHGTENLYVAARMEEVRGPNRGSYIWGR
jgi:transposase InsO family protein